MVRGTYTGVLEVMDTTLKEIERDLPSLHNFISYEEGLNVIIDFDGYDENNDVYRVTEVLYDAGYEMYWV